MKLYFAPDYTGCDLNDVNPRVSATAPGPRGDIGAPILSRTITTGSCVVSTLFTRGNESSCFHLIGMKNCCSCCGFGCGPFGSRSRVFCYTENLCRPVVSHRVDVLAADPRECCCLQFERDGVASSPFCWPGPFDCEAWLWVLAFLGALVVVICCQQLVDGFSCCQRVRSRSRSRSSSSSSSSSSSNTATGL